jgi:MoaA/NifB/PqqE/SkfB family radical SAM enzyme
MAVLDIFFGAEQARASLSEGDLLTDRVDVVIFETTTNCNLRCTYCGLSLPWYVGSDFDFSRIEKLVSEMAAAKVASVQISGHGETTMIPNWESFCKYFQDHGIALSITSNFATVYSEAEVDALARMAWITISIDTADRELLKQVRRKVDLRTILYNMQAIRLRAATHYGREPVFNWQCTLTDLVAPKLPEWVQMGLLNGVTNFTFGNLVEYKELPELLAREKAVIPRHVARLEKEPLLAACRSIAEAVSLAQKAKAVVNMQPGIIEGINARLAEFAINTPFTIHDGSDRRSG